MFTATPWTAFLALIALEVVVVMVIRLGVGLASAVVHRHEALGPRID